MCTRFHEGHKISLLDLHAPTLHTLNTLRLPPMHTLNKRGDFKSQAADTLDCDLFTAEQFAAACNRYAAFELELEDVLLRTGLPASRRRPLEPKRKKEIQASLARGNIPWPGHLVAESDTDLLALLDGITAQFNVLSLRHTFNVPCVDVDDLPCVRARVQLKDGPWVFEIVLHMAAMLEVRERWVLATLRFDAQVCPACGLRKLAPLQDLHDAVDVGIGVKKARWEKTDVLYYFVACGAKVRGCKKHLIETVCLLTQLNHPHVEPVLAVVCERQLGYLGPRYSSVKELLQRATSAEILCGARRGRTRLPARANANPSPPRVYVLARVRGGQRLCRRSTCALVSSSSTVRYIWTTRSSQS
jgi:hypothetical protein